MSLSPLIFTGSNPSSLAQEVVELLGMTLAKRKIEIFPDQEISVEILESVQGRDVFVLQSFGQNLNVDWMELLIILDALKRASVSSLCVIVPYYGYARQDRLNKPGVPITAKLMANLLSIAGADRVITFDLHSEQIEGFFDIPVHHLISRKLLIPYCQSLQLEDLVVVAPDKGGVKIATIYAKELAAPLAFIEKERIDSFHVEMRLFVGDVEGKTVLLPDDMCTTGGTLLNAAQVCADFGAKRILSVVTHGVLVGNAIEKIENSPLEKLIMTNTLSLSPSLLHHPKIEIVSVASLLADLIQQLK